MTGARQGPRPGAQTPSANLLDDHPDTLHRLTMAAAELVDDVAGQAEARNAAFAEGYTLGFRAGEQVGEGRTANAALLAYDDVLAALLGQPTSPAYGELERLRYGGPRELFGRPRPGDHPGGPKAWDGGTGDQHM